MHMSPRNLLCLSLALLPFLVASVRAAPKYPSELADIVAVYPGAEVVMAAREGARIQVGLGFKTPEPEDKIMDFYKEALNGEGWETTAEMAMGPMSTAVFAKDGAELAVVLVLDEKDREKAAMINLSLDLKE